MKDETKWEDISLIISSSYRKKVLQILDNPKTPSNIAKELNINKTHISRALSELQERKMIQCLTPKANKGKLYIITEHGRSILSHLDEVS